MWWQALATPSLEMTELAQLITPVYGILPSAPGDMFCSRDLIMSNGSDAYAQQIAPAAAYTD